jgi:cation transport ATPase
MNSKVGLAGSLRFVEENVDTTATRHNDGDFAEAGLAVVAVTYDCRVIGLIGIAVTIRDDAEEAISGMKESALEQS